MGEECPIGNKILKIYLSQGQNAESKQSFSKKTAASKSEKKLI